MGKLPKGASGNTRIILPGKGATGPLADQVNTKVWSGASSAHTMSNHGMNSVVIASSPNHGGIQTPTNKGVKYKGVGTKYC